MYRNLTDNQLVLEYSVATGREKEQLYKEAVRRIRLRHAAEETWDASQGGPDGTIIPASQANRSGCRVVRGYHYGRTGW